MVLKTTIRKCSDLVKNRLISTNDVRRNEAGKVTIEAMIESIKAAYSDNRRILMLDIK